MEGRLEMTKTGEVSEHLHIESFWLNPHEGRVGREHDDRAQQVGWIKAGEESEQQWLVTSSKVRANQKQRRPARRRN